MSKTRSNRSATKHWRLQAIGLVHLESRVVNDVVDNNFRVSTDRLNAAMRILLSDI
jgi:hypothetical protein